tara:strand:+ start:11974 stop:13137 length:1164 start_codon:yes stop_codon:yes gene_type:complete
MVSKYYNAFNNLSQETKAGIVLIIATILALICSNTILHDLYSQLIHLSFRVQIGQAYLDKPLILWINDGLMSIFFFIIGLELKREILEGHLKDLHSVMLPCAAAVGGIIVPVLFFSLITMNYPEYHKGWAIPMATDIAFVVGILSLFGKKVPIKFKLFILTLAIMDDLAAILVIAIFHAKDLSYTSMIITALCIAVLFFMHKIKVEKVASYFAIGLILWLGVLKSGLHATLSGVVLAMFIPLYSKDKKEPILYNLETDLYPLVSFAIIPLFAFANAGVELTNLTLNDIFSPLTLGVFFGLFLGKPIGISLFSFIYLSITQSTSPVSFKQIIIIGFFGGIGFIMSLFIAGLSFDISQNLLNESRLGILSATFASAIVGSILLTKSLKK